MGARSRRCLERHGRRAAPAAVARGGDTAGPIWPASRAEPPGARSTMNFDELSLATGEPAGELRRWQTLGLLPMEVDAFMLVFNDAVDAIRCGLGIQGAVAEETEFPGLHVGAHCGQLLYREGDYLGNTVNVAARVAGETAANQMLVTAAVHETVKDVPDAELVSLGARTLKGVADPMEVFEVRSVGRT